MNKIYGDFVRKEVTLAATVFDFGVVTFNWTGTKTLTFTVVGKNPASTDFSGHFDRIDLEPGL